MSTHNINLCGEIRKVLCGDPLSGAMLNNLCILCCLIKVHNVIPGLCIRILKCKYGNPSGTAQDND